MPHRTPLSLPCCAALIVSVATACTGMVEQSAQAPAGAGSGRAATDTQTGAPSDPALGGSKTGANGGSGACGARPIEVGATPLRRLSNLELQLTLQDLFALPEPPSLEGVPLDNDKDGFKTFAEAQTISAQHLRAYSALARELADSLLNDAARRRKVLGCEPSAAGCVRAFVAGFGARVYRRSLDPAEIESLTKRAEENGLDANDRVRYAVQALLTSMSFLYRMEVGDQPEGTSKLRGEELAARLSFALWGRAPSAELLEQARAGILDDEKALEQTAARMAADARAEAYAMAFFRQWLGYDALRPPVTKPSGWSDSLLSDMQKETDTLVRKHALGSGSLLEAFTSNETQVTPELARFYGLTAAANGVVNIPAGHPRANTGLMSHASLLSAKSDGDLIALRGNWLRRTFLCAEMHIPPEVADELGELLVGLTRVQIVQKRTTEPTCRGCHNLIDPIGVGLIKFDPAGRWDETIDSKVYGIAPALAGVDQPRFDSIAELARKLREAPEVAACIAEKLFLYTSGRSPEEEDTCALERASARFAASGHRFRDLAVALVADPNFRLRRAPSLSAGPP